MVRRMCLFSTLVGLSTLAHAMPDGEEILAALRAGDEMFFRATHVVGLLDAPEMVDGIPPRLLEFTFTTSPDQMLVRQEVVQVKQVQTRGHSPRDGKLPMAILSLTTFREGDTVGWLSHMVRGGFDTTDMAELNSRERGHTVTMGNYQEGKLNRHFCKLVWSMGRGYAAHIDRVLEVAEEGDLLRVRAQGNFIAASEAGEWLLWIDPAKNWLVREAKFRRLHLKNEGDLGGAALPIAARALWKDTSESPVEQELLFSEASHEIPQELLPEARRQVLGPYPEPTHVKDFENPLKAKGYNAGESYSLN